MGRRDARCGDPDCPSGIPNGTGHWSHIPCHDNDRKVDHQNHVWDSNVVIYGPYWCKGYGVQAPPADPPDTQYTNDPIEAYITDGDLESMRYRADITDDDQAWERTVSYSQWRRVARD